MLKRIALISVAAIAVFAQKTQYKDVQGGPGESVLKYQFTLKPSNVTSGSIASAGSRAVTLRPCPLGVAGTNINHYVRISGGTGTAEEVLLGLQITGVTNAYPAVVTTAFAHGLTTGQVVTPFGFTGVWTAFESARSVTVLSSTTYSVDFNTSAMGAMTGTPRIPYGTCTSGASSGTVAMTTANSHSGAWTITSATAGLQEAFFTSPPIDIFMPNGAWTVYKPFSFYGQGGNTTRIRGAGGIATRLVRASTFTAGDVMSYDGKWGSGDVIIEDIGIVNGSASIIGTEGAAIHFKDCYNVSINRIAVTDGFRQFYMEGTGGLVHINDSTFRYNHAYLTAALAATAQPTAQLLIDGATLDFKGNEVVQSATESTAVPSLKLTRADGHTIENNRIGGLDGIQIAHNGVNPLNFTYIRNNVINGLWRFGIYLTDAASNGEEFQNFIISNNDIISQFQYPPHTAGGPAQHIGINADNPLLVGVKVTGNLIAGWGYDCMKVNNAKYWHISGNTFRDCNASNTTGSGIHLLGTGVGNTVTGNFSGYVSVSGAGVSRGTYQTAGLYISGSQTNITVTGNNFAYNAVLPIALISSPTITGVMELNTGVDDGFETLASNTSITTLRFGRSVNLTGNTAVTTILPTWSGRRIRFNKTDSGTVAIGGGGNIASSSVNLIQYGTVDCTFNGPQAAWMCR